jgi:hypothetical protein
MSAGAPMQSQLEALWTAQDVASYLQASRSWVYQKAEAGLLPCRRICGLLRFEPEAVRAWGRGEAGTGRVVPMRRTAP